MIFVTVGTNEAPFDRLVGALGRYRNAEELVVQHGSSSIKPAAATCVDFLPYDALLGYVRSARLIVCHAGVGSIMTVLGEGKRPVVVPRLRRFGEAVDDHQLPLARRLHAEGLVVLVEEADDLPGVIENGEGKAAGIRNGHPLLSAELRGYLLDKARIANPVRIL